jgi:beta-lactamase class A
MIVAALLLATALQAPAVVSDTAQLRQELTRITASHHGVVGISMRNLATSESISIRGDETFSTASLIKVAVLVTLMDEVQRGRMRLDEPTTMIARDRVGGTGVIRLFHSGIALTLEDLAWAMIVLSDNTATNLLLDKLDIATVNAKMDSLRLPNTAMHSKTFRRQTSIAPDSSAKYGLGVTTPNETMQLFALLHAGRAVSAQLDSVAMQMLFANQDGNMMTRWLPGSARVAHKTGSVDRSRTDCGIMYTPAAPIALCVMTKDNVDTSYGVDSEAHLTIARVAREVFRHYNPTVALPALPVVPR